MDDELKRGLLSKKTGFERMYEDGLLRVARIRQKNDAFQKHFGPDIDDQLRQEVQSQSRFIEKQITELRNVLTQMQNKYRDPQSKNKVKQLKADAHKQIQRNKIILKDIIKQSFERKSFGNKDGEDNEKYMEGGVVDYNHLNSNKQKSAKKDSLLTDPQDQPEQRQINIDYELEHKIMLEKNQMINDVEQKTQRINEIINEQGLMVDEQGQNLDVISQQLMNTNKNLATANEELQQASHLQKKSKRKYICLVGLIIVIIVAAAGVVFLVVN